MNKVSCCYPLRGKDVQDLLSKEHRLPSGGEFHNSESWMWEIRNKFCKAKFGFGKANFRIFADKLVLVNAAQSYAWVAVFTPEFAAKRQAIAACLATRNAAATKKVLGFTGIALLETGHESWSYKDRNKYHNRTIVRFEKGYPVETLVSDSYSLDYTSGDIAYECCSSTKEKKFTYSDEEWDKLTALHKPSLVIEARTRDNGEHESHEYLLDGAHIPSAPCLELLKRM